MLVGVQCYALKPCLTQRFDYYHPLVLNQDEMEKDISIAVAADDDFGTVVVAAAAADG